MDRRREMTPPALANTMAASQRRMATPGTRSASGYWLMGRYVRREWPWTAPSSCMGASTNSATTKARDTHTATARKGGNRKYENG